MMIQSSSPIISARVWSGFSVSALCVSPSDDIVGFADFNAKNNKKNLHDCNEYMNNDELRNTLKFSTNKVE